MFVQVAAHQYSSTLAGSWIRPTAPQWAQRVLSEVDGVNNRNEGVPSEEDNIKVHPPKVYDWAASPRRASSFKWVREMGLERSAVPEGPPYLF